MAHFVDVKATTFVEKLADSCIGFHFASDKSLGKTTHAFLAKHDSQSPALKVYNEIESELKSDRSIVDLMSPAHNRKAIVALVRTISTNAMGNRVAQVDLSALTAPVLLNVKGSAVDSIATLCRIKGYVRLTSEFYTCELEIMSALCREAALIGKSHAHTTVAKRIVEVNVKPTGSRLGLANVRDLLIALRLTTRADFGIALASVFKALQVVRRGFLDSGKLFRDNSSRNLAADAYREAMYNVLNIIL
jgi:hypothetical protein